MPRPSAMRVHRPLGLRQELHDEQVEAVLGQQLDRLLEAHRERAGPLVEELVRAVDGRVEDAEAARAARERRLEADGTVGVAELSRGCVDAGGTGHAAERRARRTPIL